MTALAIYSPQAVLASENARRVHEGFANNTLYSMSLEDVEDRAGGSVFCRTDILTDVTTASWKPLGEKSWRWVDINVPLCGGCDVHCPDGICDCGDAL